MATSLSDVLFLQEAKVTADMLLDVQNTLLKSGWSGAFSPAISTSRLGGVALLTRTHVGMCSMAYGADANCSHEVESGRVVEAFLPVAGVSCCAPVYLHDDAGLDDVIKGSCASLGKEFVCMGCQ